MMEFRVGGELSWEKLLRPWWVGMFSDGRGLVIWVNLDLMLRCLRLEVAPIVAWFRGYECRVAGNGAD